MFRLAAQGAMQSKTAVGAFIRRLSADWVHQRRLTLELTNLHGCSTACSSLARLTTSKAKPTMSKGTKTAYSITSLN